MSDSVTATPAAHSAPIEGVQETQTPQPQQTEKPKDDFLAPKFAALTRKEKEIRAKEAAIKAQQAEVERLRAEIESKAKSSQEQESAFMQKLKANPLKALKEFGYDFEKLTEMQLNDENPTTEMQMQRMREELREELLKEIGGVKETLAEKEKREAQEAYDRAVNGYKSELQSFIQQNSEKYELIAANGATDLMFETAEEFYNKTGKVPDIDELAQAVESHLEEQANQIFKLKKFQKMKPQEPEAKPEASASKTAQTLSNTLAAEVPKSGHSQLTAEQSKKEAAKLIRWNS